MFVQCEPDWALGHQAIVVWCKSEREARDRVRQEYDKWANLAAVFRKTKTLLKYPHCKGEGFPVLASTPTPTPTPSEFDPVLTVPQIYMQSPFPASIDLLRGLETISSNPDEKYFLHRISPDCNRMIQIAVSSAAQELIIGATPQQAVGRSRDQYMPPDELHRMQQTFRQDLSIGGRGIEFGFKLFSPVTRSNWRYVDYEYQLIGELPGGDLLQLGKCVGVQPIAAPVR